MLFVSHNMAAIAELASCVVLLRHESVAIDGEASQALSTYLSEWPANPIYVSSHDEHYERPYIARAEVLTSHPNAVQHSGELLDIKVWIWHCEPLVRGALGIRMINQLRVAVTNV